MVLNKINKKGLKIATIISSILFLGLGGYNIYINEKEVQKNKESVNIINSSDFIMGLKKVSQLEYVTGDSTVNINPEYNYYKTFKNNTKYEIFIDKKSEDIDSLHYTSPVNDIKEEDIKYLKNIYNLSFSNISTYLFDETMRIVNMMCSSDYMSSKATSILKNNVITEYIPIGKTSEIGISVIYTNKGTKCEPITVDISILKGNKW